MQHQKLSAIFGFIAGIAQAAPSPAASATTGFSSKCSNITFNTNWLVANCPNDAGTLVSSGVYLPSYVTNTEGKLEWKADGAYEQSCSDCVLLDSGATLQCYCRGTFTKENGNSTLNLEEYIANYNGHLLSSLERTPTIPSDSSLPVPSNVVLSLRSYANGAACSNSSGGILNFAGPETCWDLTVAVDPIVWTGFQPTSNEGWSISVYNISTCTGTPLVTFDQNSVNECITVGKNGGAYLSLTPLWNYD
ncbi:conserved hypothetical protein [Talaromyces marneffei ATCC 18224]|uniref:Cyanovirin-N domain-containing protein n=3 Tax=Talaromyces marneffei TaxID=37727 RepID=B6QJB5_TALMQ|nr:conserved hypothetical protein [Talaromyces marneffei ATCC 18224]